jgi:hypothetical protein
MHGIFQWRAMVLIAAMTLTGCIPAGGGGGDDDDGGAGGEGGQGGEGGEGGQGGDPLADQGIDPDDGIPRDQFVDPDEGIDPDDGIDPDRGIDPDDGIPPDPDRGIMPDAMLVDIDPACEPADEACNSRDDDCDGRVDEALGGAACNTGLSGLCATGEQLCQAGALVCLPTVQPRGETCDGLDNDCNGVPDDAPGVGDACQAGLGACQTAGRLVCRAGAVQCDAQPPAPQAERCAPADEDCDGRVDEGGVCAAVEICGNGLDDDRDGLTDCADADCAGDLGCAPVRPIVMLCGGSERDISVIFRPADGVALVAGCAPDVRTQALLITRNGVINGATVAAYLRAGGRVITEYTSTAAAFNGVFATNVVAPANQTGGCLDNINPVVRYNEADPFWLDNPGLPREVFDNSGCGYSVAAYPNITRLGGWDANTVSLAYRTLGNGRFWLVESDWQDNQLGAGAFSAATRQLFRYMILGRAAGPVEPIDGIPLDPNQGYGHHGNCETFNDCGDAQTCADLACLNQGFGTPALSFEEGSCDTLAAGPVPNIVCNLFRGLDPFNLDVGWGPSLGCNISVAYAIVCSEP